MCAPCWQQWHEQNTGAKYKWAKDNPEKRKESYRRSYEKNKDKLLRKQRRLRVERPWLQKSHFYNATEAELAKMFADQNEQCAGCRLPLKFGKDVPRFARPHVDHDHATGEVRFILCGWCNACIGQAKEDPDRMEGCAALMRAWRSRQSLAA